jgi:3D (Asp-Asp-Asp) domain-containing protein
MKRTLYFAGVLAIVIVIAGTFPSTTTYEQPPRNSWPYLETHPVPSIEPIKDEIMPLPQIKATSTSSTTPETSPDSPQNQSGDVLLAQVTAYNTVPAQTDSTPCISASGDNICGRDDVVACPTSLPLGTLVEINGKIYECLDRTHPRFGHRFDISFDKDIEGALAWGIRIVEVRVV